MAYKPALVAALVSSLLVSLCAVASAQRPLLMGPVDNAVTTRGVTAWWANTHPAGHRACPPCACRTSNAHESALLTCYGAMAGPGLQASCVSTWKWDCPAQRAVRMRCAPLQCLCPRPCKSSCCVDPCACSWNAACGCAACGAMRWEARRCGCDCGCR